MATYPILLKPSFSYNDFLMYNKYVSNITDGISKATTDIVKAQAFSSKILHEGMAKNSTFIANTIDSNFRGLNDNITTMSSEITTSISSGIESVNDNISKLESGIDRGFDTINNSLVDVSSNITTGLNQVSSDIKSFHSDFNIAMGGVSIALEMQREEMKQGFNSIIDILENRRKTDAQEDFKDAIDYYNDGCRLNKPIWFENAQKHFISSIKKYERNPLAHLHLAHIYHYQDEFRDFDKALKHYEFCYTYGEADEKSDAITAQGYFYAGWLKAIVYDDIDSAIELTKNAIKYDKKFSQSYYHLAKFYAIKKDSKNSIQYLQIAIEEFDKNYTIQTLKDADFDNIKDDLDNFLISLKEKTYKQVATNYKNFVNKIKSLEIAKEDLEKITPLLDSIKNAKNSYFDNLNSIKTLKECEILFNSFNLEQRDKLKTEILQTIDSVKYKYEDIFKEFIEFSNKAKKLLGTPQTYKTVSKLYKELKRFTLKIDKFVFDGHSNDVTSVAFSPDGRFIASGSDDEIVHLWDIEESEYLKEGMSLLEYLSSLEDIREEKERQRKEKIEQERLKQEQTWRENGMCEKCGKKLGFFEKLAGNIRCESCRKKS